MAKMGEKFGQHKFGSGSSGGTPSHRRLGDAMPFKWDRIDIPRAGIELILSDGYVGYSISNRLAIIAAIEAAGGVLKRGVG